MKRRLKDAGLPLRLSPHSFRVSGATKLLEQGVSLEDVQNLLGHADPSTTPSFTTGGRETSRGTLWSGFCDLERITDFRNGTIRSKPPCVSSSGGFRVCWSPTFCCVLYPVSEACCLFHKHKQFRVWRIIVHPDK